MKKYRVILISLLLLLNVIVLCGCTKRQTEETEKGNMVDENLNSNNENIEDMEQEEASYRVENGTAIFQEGITQITHDMFNSSSETYHITLPDSVTYIAAGSFASSNVIFVDMSEAKCTLKNNTFEACSELEEVVLPKESESIPDSCFWGCESLKKIQVPDSVHTIEKFAFNECESLEVVEFGANVKQINMKAFFDCHSLKDVVLPKSLEKIEIWAFQRCFELEYITIPEKVSMLEDGVFIDCKKLKAVTIGKCENFADDIFSGCNDLVIYGLEGTTAQTYAKENNIPFELLSMKEEAVTLKANDTYQLELNSKAICDWTSSDETVVSVDENGMVTANKAGKAIVTASIYGENFTCEVTVE